MSVEDLVKAITECKEQVVLAPSGGDKKKNLTHQLIQLRLQLAEAKVSLNLVISPLYNKNKYNIFITFIYHPIQLEAALMCFKVLVSSTQTSSNPAHTSIPKGA